MVGDGQMREKLYCIHCGKPKRYFIQDSRGCETFKKFDKNCLTPRDIFLCSECISKFQYVKDLPQIQKEAYQFYSKEYMPIITALFKIQSELGRMNDEARG